MPDVKNTNQDMAENQENTDFEIENSTLKQEETVPELYSKTLILLFSILFSMIFSAVLLMSNLKSLGKGKARVQVLLFSVLYLVATALALQVFELPLNLTFVANVIGAAILNEYFWNKLIGKDLEYTRKSWVKPLIISVIIALSFFLLLAGIM